MRFIGWVGAAAAVVACLGCGGGGGAEQAAALRGNLQQISLAFLNFQSVRRKLPTDVVSSDGKPLLSWRTQILEHLDEAMLSEKVKKDQAWDAEANRPLVATTPKAFQVPGVRPGYTSVFVIKGPGAAFDKEGGVKSAGGARDGASNTILLIVAKPEKAVPWTQPSDLEYDPAKLAELVEALPEKNVVAGLFDGAVVVWKERPKAEVLKALVTVDGGEAFVMPE